MRSEESMTLEIVCIAACTPYPTVPGGNRRVASNAAFLDESFEEFESLVKVVSIHFKFAVEVGN